MLSIHRSGNKTVEGTDSISGGNTETTEIGTRETISTGESANGNVEVMPVKSDGGIGRVSVPLHPQNRATCW